MSGFQFLGDEMDDENGPDWAAIRRAVEAGEGSQREIAKRFGVGLSALAMRKYRGGWINPADVEKLMKIEDDLEGLTAGMMKRLKKASKHGDQLDARARELIHAQCDGAETLKRLDLHVKQLEDMAPVLRMTADLTRLMERKARAGAALRATHAALEAHNDRPDFIAFERAVLARIAAARAGGNLEPADAGGEASDDGVLGVSEERGPDAA